MNYYETVEETLQKIAANTNRDRNFSSLRSLEPAISIVSATTNTAASTVTPPDLVQPRSTPPTGSVLEDDRRARRKLAMLQRSGLFGGETQGVRIVRASSLPDLTAAYKLVHHVFVENGFVNAHSSGLRVRIFEAATTVATFVAKEPNGKVVGAISVVADSPELGLPSDTAFGLELDALRDQGRKVCEISNQVVAKEYRKSGVPTELMRCAMAHLHSDGFNEAVASVSPSHKGFYDLLNFREIGAVRSYSEKLNDPVVGLSMDVDPFSRSPAGLDAAKAFVHNFLVAENPFAAVVKDWAEEAGRHFRQVKLLRKLFITKADFISQCSRAEREILKKFWGRSLFDEVTGNTFASKAIAWVAAAIAMVIPGPSDPEFSGFAHGSP